MALMYFVLVIIGIAYIVFGALSQDVAGEGAIMLITGIMMLVGGVVFTAAFVMPFFLSPKPWTWIYHLVLICVGFGSACCLPISVPLLIFWIKHETREYFGRTDINKNK